MAKRIITSQILDDLFIDAMGGDSDAERQYRELARLLAKRSNQQMLQQERRDITGEAYRRAQTFLGDTSRFRENTANTEITALREQVNEMMIFQSSRDYSVVYAGKSKIEIGTLMPALQAAGVDVSDERVTFWMNEMFKTGAWQEYKKAHGKSTDLIIAAQDQFKKGKTVDDLLDAYKEYTRERDDKKIKSIDIVQSFNKFAPGSW